MLLQPSTSVVGVRLAAPVGLWHLVGTKRAGCWWWWWSDPSQCLRAVQTSDLSFETKNKCVAAVNLSFKEERVSSASCFRVLPRVARERALGEEFRRVHDGKSLEDIRILLAD